MRLAAIGGALGLLPLSLVLAACAGGSPARSTPRPQAASEEAGMRLISSAFEHGGAIPRRFTCDGDDVSPPLALHDIPPDAASLVLVMDDPDAPRGSWDHWVVYDIPVSPEIPEAVAALGTLGRNSWGRDAYGGPCPPGGTHRYVFTVYALDTRIGLPMGADKTSVKAALDGHVLATATLMGWYRRQ